MIFRCSIGRLFMFLVALISILFSKSYYFGVANRNIYQYIFYATTVCAVFFASVRVSKMKKTGLWVTPFLLLFMANSLIYMGEMTSNGMNQVLGNALVFICVAISASYLPREVFSKHCINIISLICLVSIPCFIIALTNKELALSLCQPGYNWQVPVGYSFFYTWGWNGTIFSRNSGIFWEPGAFQGFIVLAMLLMLYNCDNEMVKNRKMKFTLLTVTLFTTQSSTGYILLVFLLLTQWGRVQAVYGDINKNVRNILVAVLSIGAIYIIVSSGNITAKLANVTSNSASIRWSDFVGGGLMIIKGGLFGLGETAMRNSYRMLLGVSTNDSVGLIAMAYTYGILFAITYVMTMVKGFIRFLKVTKISESIVVISILLILHMTEGLWYLPVYLLIPAIGIAQKQSVKSYNDI